MHVVRKILLTQTGVTLGVALGTGAVFGRTAGYSALIGGLLCVLPNAFLAGRIFLAGAEDFPRSTLRAAWFGEAGKLFLTALGFVLTFMFVRPLDVLALFGGFIIAQSIIWMALFAAARTS